MFGMSLAEIGLIMVLALVVLGPEKLPEVARTLGKTLREIRRAGNMLRDAVMLEEELNDYRTANRALPGTSTGAAAASTSSAPAQDLDDFDGPLDQIDDEEFGLGGSMTYDPHAYTDRERRRFDVTLRRPVPSPQEVTEVELSPQRPPQDNEEALARYMASPFQAPLEKRLEVFLPVQHPEIQG